MIIGVDFDNTIVCYEGIFHSVALERGLIPRDLPTDKTSVRDYLRKTGREEAWTEMQGYVYGPGLQAAQPYAGVIEFFRAAVSLGIAVRIVSHKTRRPFLGEPHDLHAAAWKWLERSGILGPDQGGIGREHVFLEETLDAKFQRIRTECCTHFIDDLPEFLSDSRFPESVERLLFAPKGDAALENLVEMRSWSEIELALLPSGPTEAVLSLARDVLSDARPQGRSLTGGANNRVFHFQSGSRETIIKAYHHAASDRRDRFSAEQRFYGLLGAAEIPQTPVPLAWDSENRLCALSVARGRKLQADQVSDQDVAQCIEWVTNLQRFRGHPLASSIAPAADACFSLNDHLALAERRVNRLLAAASNIENVAFKAFVNDELSARFDELSSIIRQNAVAPVDQPLEERHWILSPSDFGFHNALQDAEGRMSFLDFEYAGWDDPAKLLADFFCQPQVPVALDHSDAFVRALEEAVGDFSLSLRFRQLLPLHAVKWSCILLNEFLPQEASRRRFAGIRLSAAEMQAVQLEKSRRMLAISLSFA